MDVFGDTVDVVVAKHSTATAHPVVSGVRECLVFIISVAIPYTYFEETTRLFRRNDFCCLDPSKYCFNQSINQ